MIRCLMSLVFGFFCFQNVMANDSSLSSIYLGSREGDPASLVENVSTIHGDYTEVEVDLVVPAPDSLILSRFYSSRDTIQTAPFGGWRFNPHCFLRLQKDSQKKSKGKMERICAYVGNSDGAILTYVGWQNPANSSQSILFQIDVEGEMAGVTNTAKGIMSCWTNLKKIHSISTLKQIVLSFICVLKGNDSILSILQQIFTILLMKFFLLAIKS